MSPFSFEPFDAIEMRKSLVMAKIPGRKRPLRHGQMRKIVMNWLGKVEWMYERLFLLSNLTRYQAHWRCVFWCFFIMYTCVVRHTDRKRNFPFYKWIAKRNLQQTHNWIMDRRIKRDDIWINYPWGCLHLSLSGIASARLLRGLGWLMGDVSSFMLRRSLETTSCNYGNIIHKSPLTPKRFACLNILSTSKYWEVHGPKSF